MSRLNLINYCQTHRGLPTIAFANKSLRDRWTEALGDIFLDMLNDSNHFIACAYEYDIMHGRARQETRKMDNDIKLPRNRKQQVQVARTI